jgi:hypothetical protein
VLVIAVALGWSWVSRTDWAASVPILEAGQDYENALQPIIKVAAAIIVMVAATQLAQKAFHLPSRHGLVRHTRRSTKPMRTSSG